MSKWTSGREALPNLEIFSSWVAHASAGTAYVCLSLWDCPLCSHRYSLSLPFRPTEPQSSLIHHLCKKDCVRSRGDEELVRRTLGDQVSRQSPRKDVVTEKGTVGKD